MRLAIVLALAACARKDGAAPASRAAPDAAPPRPSIADARIADAAPGIDGAIATLPAGCEGVPDDAVVTALPSGGFAARRGDDRWLVLDGEACRVFSVGRANARVHAPLWPGHDRVKAFAITQECEDPDGCASVIAVRTEDGAVLDAIDACDRAAEIGLHVVEIFEDRPSLLASCVTHTGYGLEERHALLHVVDGALRRVLLTRGAWGDHGPSDACVACRDHCWTELDEARWKVIERGAAPVVETRAPTSFREQRGEAIKPGENVIRWTFEPARKVFHGAARRRERTEAARDVCAPRALRTPLR